MQKLINVLAISSFVVSGAVVAGGSYLYFNKDSIIEQVKANVTKAAMSAISDALPGMMDGLMPDVPELPTSTGPAVPFGKSGSGVNMP